MDDIRAVLIDIDGVLAVSWKPLAGAVEALSAIRAAGTRIALLTNTTSRTRARIAETLAGQGFEISQDDILTAPALAAAFLAGHHPGARCLLLNDGDISEDLTGVTLITEQDAADHRPDVVLLGGAGPQFSYEALNRVFGYVEDGAILLALARNLSWRTDAGLQLDTGAFVLGLERAAGVPAEVTGKPAAAFFEAALDHLGVSASDAIMVGDDLESDVLGAQDAGIRGVLVRTGKFRKQTLDDADGEPWQVIDSFADVPALLGLSTSG